MTRRGRSTAPRGLDSERGLTLVEVTVILMVLASLTAVLAPAARAYVEDARNVRAKADVEGIGAALNALLRDTGLPCVAENGSSCANANNGLVELLVSGDGVSNNEPEVSAAALAGLAGGVASDTALNWAGAGGGGSEIANTRRNLMDDHFVGNGAGYAGVTFDGGGGPRVGAGWRGPYVSGPIDLDPWGYSYQVSTVFLAVASDAPDGTTEGLRRGGWARDVVAISAGSNATIQTPFGSAATTAVGDDVVFVVQGTTH